MSYTVPEIRTIHIDRYVLPLREGGSMPGLVEGDDGFKYVIKFHGAAQGAKVLIAELIGGELARAIGLKVPEIVFAELDKAYGRTEHDEEIQNQLKASAGLNIGLSYLSGSITYDPTVNRIDPMYASKIVWLDSLITNVDRTARNTNMLYWNKELWLIDHGASLYFHYNWDATPQQLAIKPFTAIKNHVLLQHATLLDVVDVDNQALLTEQVVQDIIAMIPDEWLIPNSPFDTVGAHRQAYLQYLLMRIKNSDKFINEAKHARQETV